MGSIKNWIKFKKEQIPVKIEGLLDKKIEPRKVRRIHDKLRRELSTLTF